MASIVTSNGTLNFFSVTADFDPPGEQLERLERPNVNGLAFRKTGIRGKQFRMIIRAHHASASAWVNDTEAMKANQGFSASVTDDHGVTHTNVVILDVRPQRPRPADNASDGTTVLKSRMECLCVFPTATVS